MTATVNGTETSRGCGPTSTTRFGAMLARASADVQLRPGDLIGSGTVGTGCLLEIKDETLGRWLEPGDEVVLSVERFGGLRTAIVARPGRRCDRPITSTRGHVAASWTSLPSASDWWPAAVTAC